MQSDSAFRIPDSARYVCWDPTGRCRGVMSITVMIVLLVLLVIGVAAFGMRREQAEHPAGAQTLAVVLIVVVAVLILVYLVMQRSR
jgi:heme/copper-type cytochrome/quinol oxidase subunit 2